MIFTVDEEKKRGARKAYLRSRKRWTSLSCGIILFFILFNIGFGIFGIADRNTFLITDQASPACGQKDTLFVWAVLIAVDAFIAALWAAKHIAAVGAAAKYFNIDERLSINKEYIEYSYRNSVHSKPGDRAMVRAKTDSIRKIDVHERDHVIDIYGEVSFMYYSDCAGRRVIADAEGFGDGRFVIFDYFSPELVPYLRKMYGDRVRTTWP